MACFLLRTKAHIARERSLGTTRNVKGAVGDGGGHWTANDEKWKKDMMVGGE